MILEQLERPAERKPGAFGRGSLGRLPGQGT